MLPEIVSEYLSEDGLGLAAGVREGKFKPEQLLDVAIDRARTLNPRLGALCCINESQGQAALSRLKLDAPFVGAPFLMKDLGAPVAGFPTIAGARYFTRHAKIELSDGDLTARMRKAGAIIFGKTSVPEMGLNLTTEPAIGPTACNPWDNRFSAGALRAALPPP